jgi:DnaJ-class molecular chaperone
MTFTMNDLIELEDMVSAVIGIARRSGEGPHVQKICDRAKAATVKAIIALRCQTCEGRGMTGYEETAERCDNCGGTGLPSLSQPTKTEA